LGDEMERWEYFHILWVTYLCLIYTNFLSNFTGHHIWSKKLGKISSIQKCDLARKESVLDTNRHTCETLAVDILTSLLYIINLIGRKARCVHSFFGFEGSISSISVHF
jgi:hypothetical protein